jgi:type II secretory pathway pseudopilin PulG
MHLDGQYEPPARPDAGYAMAVLLAGLAIMSIAWTVVVPVWKQAVQREKEAELIFRAGQYARAVALYQRKYANAFPPNVDVLLREKFLRRKYKDPVTNGEFRYLSPLELQALPGLVTTTQPGLPGTSPAGPPPRPPFGDRSGSGTDSRGSGPGGRDAGTTGGRPSAFGPSGLTGGPSQGIAAVVSRSSAASIKVFKNRRQYNQWIVTVQDVMPRSAAGSPQPGQPGMPGMPGMQPGRTSPFGGPGASPRTTSPGRPSGPVP